MVQVEEEQVGSRIVLMGLLESGAKIELPKNLECGSIIIVDPKFGKFVGVRKGRTAQ